MKGKIILSIGYIREEKKDICAQVFTYLLYFVRYGNIQKKKENIYYRSVVEGKRNEKTGKKEQNKKKKRTYKR